MARKSNKTAHVLNLLAGHDNQSNPDETIETTSAEAETPAEMSASESPAPADSETPAASTPQVQNISVIDTTGEDPVADLIQQKLSAQFDEPVSVPCHLQSKRLKHLVMIMLVFSLCLAITTAYRVNLERN